ncbi:MAG: hypothetical protein ABH819_00680 [Patescibacteria group bacterium]
MKKCPFCKRDIDNGASECPHCKRILIEFTGTYFSAKNKPDKNDDNNSFNKTKDNTRHFRFSKPSFNLKYLWIIPVIILFIAGANSNTANPTDNSSATPSETFLPVNYTRLANGTILSSTINNGNSQGTLEIDNGTNDDAIAKLVDINNQSTVITVFIQATSKFTITNISDGKYDLLFHTGKDWSKEKKKFLFNPSYSKFEDDFKYTTTSKKYTIYEVTLNPVMGGTAKTDSVTESEFENY